MNEINRISNLNSLKLVIKRTSRVVMTDEARVLKELRMERGFSMRAMGAALGKSDSYISQVENGRMDVPKDDALDRYLEALGIMNARSFHNRVLRFRVDRGHTDREELMEIAKRANDIQLKNILFLAKTILAAEPQLVR